MEQKIKCPDCSGYGAVEVDIHRPELPYGHDQVERECTTCDGLGAVPIPDVEVGDQVVHTETAYCGVIVELDGHRADVELENGERLEGVHLCRLEEL